MDIHGLLSLLPPVIAILLAIISRRVIVSLLAGIFVGAILLGEGAIDKTILLFFESYLWANLVDQDHLRVFAFTLLMGALVGVIGHTGGMRGIVRLLAPLARGRRGTQITTWLMGMVIFFDDYANTLLLGTSMQPLADRFRVSREKLAYIVDSTAAPVAGLALVSTWVASEIGYIQGSLKGLTFSDGEPTGMGLFIASIPYRFYVWAALLFVVLVAITKRDFGPMLAAERKATSSDPSTNKGASLSIENLSSSKDRASLAILPIFILLAITIGLLFATGYDPALSQSPLAIFCNGDSYVALLYGSLAGLLLGIAMGWKQSISFEAMGEAAMQGARRMLPALAILWMAWTLSSMTGPEALGTASYLGTITSKVMTPLWLPSVIFLLASVVAFSTGTSWGTMAILMPIAMQTAHAILLETNGAVASNDPIFLATIGSVLAGAIFGDHCSPISDTTVLSSQASGCDHIAHVVTQMPYAISAALVSIICGTLPVALGASVWLLLPVGCVALLAILFLFGKKVEDAPLKES